MQFLKLVDVFEKLEETPSSNSMINILSNFFKKVPKDDIGITCYFILGKITPDYKDIDMGIADKMAIQALKQASGKEKKKIDKLYQKKGDLGLVAKELIFNKGNLQIKEIYQTLHKVAKASGKGSQNKKINLIEKLYKKCSPQEANYLTKIILGDLRLGCGDMTLLYALAKAFTGKKENKKQLEHAYNINPDIKVIAETVSKKGLKGINKISVQIGKPIKMMLAQRVKKIKQIKKKIPGKIAAEEKIDGERIQVHKSGKGIILFSRRMEDITHQFPDVVKQIKKHTKGRRFIIEGEVAAIDKDGNLLPFQKLMQRRRKYDIEEYIKKIPVCFYLFDLIYYGRTSYLKKTYPQRRERLEKVVKKKTKHLQLIERKVSEDNDKIEEFFNEAISHGAEGIIAKSTGKDSIYKAGTRGWRWIKWKTEYAKKLADTFDLVVVGAFSGKGKRKGTYGALLCAAYNKKEDRFETVCKLGSGFTDEQLENLPKKLKKFKNSKKPARLKINKNMKPDHWFKPGLVVEVLGAELTRSPIHSAAEKDGKGLALRFPRFKNYRKDKKPEQATTIKEVKEMA